MADTIRDVVLEVNGRGYSGWKSIRVTLSIESLAGSFALEVTDRWGDNPWPIVEGDECRVAIEDEVLIDGFVDSIEISASDNSRTLTFGGSDRAKDLVDCSLLVPDASTKGNKWTYRNLNIAQFAAAVAAPHGIRVSVQPGLVLPIDPVLVAHPGETGFEAIKRVAGSAGVIVVSDGAGGIVITRAGTTRAAPLVEGQNIKAAQMRYNAADRFHTYIIASQPPGTDEASGESCRVQASAIDADVRRTNRVLVVRPDKSYDRAGAQRRINWEARARAARGATGSITVQGLKQPSGKLWPVNAITRVIAPRLLGVDGDLLTPRPSSQRARAAARRR